MSNPPSNASRLTELPETPPALPETQEQGDEPEQLQPDPDLPDDTPENHEDPPDDAPSLARSLELLASKIGSLPASKPKSGVKPRVPDTFDGTDPHKLETFTFQCSMYLAARASEFPDDETRVTFVLSYLKGTPLEWFQTEINSAMADEDLNFPE